MFGIDIAYILVWAFFFMFTLVFQITVTIMKVAAKKTDLSPEVNSLGVLACSMITTLMYFVCAILWPVYWLVIIISKMAR